MISCAPVSRPLWLFCWVEPSRRQNPHLSQHEHRDMLVVRQDVRVCTFLSISSFLQTVTI